MFWHGTWNKNDKYPDPIFCCETLTKDVYNILGRNIANVSPMFFAKKFQLYFWCLPVEHVKINHTGGNHGCVSLEYVPNMQGTLMFCG